MNRCLTSKFTYLFVLPGSTNGVNVIETRGHLTLISKMHSLYYSYLLGPNTGELDALKCKLAHIVVDGEMKRCQLAVYNVRTYVYVVTL